MDMDLTTNTARSAAILTLSDAPTRHGPNRLGRRGVVGALQELEQGCVRIGRRADRLIRQDPLAHPRW